MSKSVGRAIIGLAVGAVMLAGAFPPSYMAEAGPGKRSIRGVARRVIARPVPRGAAPSGFPEKCNQPHTFVCLWLYNGVPDQGVSFFVDQQARGYAGPGGSVFTETEPGPRALGATSDKGQTAQRRENFRAGTNFAWCIIYENQPIPPPCSQG